MTHPLVEYFRCPEPLARIDGGRVAPASRGFFRMGPATCYGRLAPTLVARDAAGPLIDVSGEVKVRDGRVHLPFDLAEVLSNLRCERYPRGGGSALGRVLESALVHDLYYLVRPVLPVAVRRPLQKLRLNGWEHVAFPGWPVDATVETLMVEAVRHLLTHGGMRELPFVWFWPDGAAACLLLTHDVEGTAGARFADALMDLDEGAGFRSAFQLVPEAKSSRSLLGRCRARGFEVNVHDLNHDGHLFRDRLEFEARMRAINAYAREYGARGFRSGAMYRRQDWFDAFAFDYDMSVPTVAHFEPQQGGCCTVMPFFIGDVLELPLTTTQDYALFHYLREHRLDLWRAQVERIVAHHGLVSFIVHPDYLAGDARAQAVYRDLLAYLGGLRDAGRIWSTVPGEVDTWWRQRRQMTLVPDGEGWRIEGPGRERARVAVARLAGDGVEFTVGAAS